MIRLFNAWIEEILRERRRRERRRYRRLAEAATREGRRLETLSVEKLIGLDETEVATTVDGLPCSLAVEARELPEGGVFVCINAHGLGRWRKQPGYHFAKHPDGSVDYAWR